MACVSVPFTELHKHAYTILLLFWYRCVLFTNKVWEFNLLQGLHSIAQPSFVHVSLSISELHVREHAYSHCFCWGAKRALFTNKLSEYWCHIIKPYLFTKFHTSKHLDKRVTQTSMFTLFFVVVRKGYCLPTSYQNVGVILSLIPTCLLSFIHPSI